MKTLLRVCLLAATMLMVSRDPAGADAVPSVRVRFEVLSPTLARQWGATASGAVAGDVQRALTQKLKARLPHWEYEPVDSTAAPPAHQLVFQVADDQSDLSVKVTLRAQGFTSPPLTARWLARDDIFLLGYPSPATAAVDIVSAIATQILERYERDLLQWLSQYVPIADGAQWIRESPPRLVLALPWNRYESLRESAFRLICAWPGQGTATVESRGPGLTVGAPYAPSSNVTPVPPPFDGVVVVALEREYLGTRISVDQIKPELLFQLEPRFIFLKEYHPVVGGWNVAGGQP